MQTKPIILAKDVKYASCEACNPRTGEILLTEEERYALNNGICTVCYRDEEACNCAVELGLVEDEPKDVMTMPCCNQCVLDCMCDIPF